MLAAPPGALCAPGFADYDCRTGGFPLCRFLSSGGARGGKARLDSDLRRRQCLPRRPERFALRVLAFLKIHGAANACRTRRFLF